MNVTITRVSDGVSMNISGGVGGDCDCGCGCNDGKVAMRLYH